MKLLSTICMTVILNLLSLISFAQDVHLKMPASEVEIGYIEDIFEELNVQDQMYRSCLQYETTDESVIDKIDSLFNTAGIQEGLAYAESLKLSLDPEVKDSIWRLQRRNDFNNHIMLRGLIDTYGMIPKSVVEEKNYMQTILLLHPPAEWDVETYHQEYAEKLLVEVKAGRMTPKAYATFYDNILYKILRRPQLYGTGTRMDFKTMKELPPIIEDLDKANEARERIGLPHLEVGQYVLQSSVKK